MLGLARSTLREACLEQRLEPWDDPHNRDPSYARVRVRHQVLPALEEALGPGIAEALARTAAQLAADCDALDDIARGEEGRIRGPDAAGGITRDTPGGTVATLDIEGLAGLAPAIRTRVLRQAALLAGCPGGSLTSTHIAALDALVTGWHGQRGADLPGAVQVQRRYGRLLFSGGGVVRGGPVRVGPPERTEAEATGGRE
jgi:tRNA(Ile)-lysidine synthase